MKVQQTGIPWNDPSGDRLRLWLDDRLLIDLHPGAGPFSAEAELTGKPQALRVELERAMGDAAPRLSWSGPGLPEQVVPAGCLFTDETAAKR